MSKDLTNADILYAEENVFNSGTQVNDRPVCFIDRNTLVITNDYEFIEGTINVDGENFPFSYDAISEEYEINNFGMPLPDVFYNDVYSLISFEINDAINEFCILTDQEKEILVLGQDMGVWYDEILDNEDNFAMYQNVEAKARLLANMEGISFEDFLDNEISSLSHDEEER